jgi:squalene-associated FAD-dependent desaturase
MGGPGEPIFPFMDLQTNERWLTKMSMGRMPWWIFYENRRVPGTSPIDYLSVVKLLTAGEDDTIASRFNTNSTLYRRFWEPMVIGVLNTEPEIASAQLLANVFVQSFGAGGRACIPLIPKTGLSETFVQPCLNILQQHGAEIHYSHRLGGLTFDEQTVREMQFNSGTITIPPEDWVILALPAWVAREILPALSTPTEFRSIVNAHYRVEVPNNAAGFTGLIGGMAEWAFVRDGIASVTISCAERFEHIAVRDIAAIVWRDLARLFDCDADKIPPHRIFKEKYATFSATPEQNRLRPTSYTGLKNLALAGEWTATGLPSTIEGAIRSGVKAAQVVMRWS